MRREDEKREMQARKPESESKGAEGRQPIVAVRESKCPELYFKLVGLGIVVLILMQSYVIVRSEPTVLLGSGSVITLSPGSPYSRVFSVSRFSMLSGGFNATGPAIMIISTLSQGKSPSPRCPGCYVYSSVSYGLEAVFSTGLGPGSYWLNFMEGNQSATTSVTIAQSITLTPV